MKERQNPMGQTQKPIFNLMKEVKSNGTLNKIFEYKFNERGKIQWDTK